MDNKPMKPEQRAEKISRLCVALCANQFFSLEQMAVISDEIRDKISAEIKAAEEEAFKGASVFYESPSEWFRNITDTAFAKGYRRGVEEEREAIAILVKDRAHTVEQTMVGLHLASLILSRPKPGEEKI